MQEKGAPKSKCQARWFQRWESEEIYCDQVPYILRYCWGVEVATFHHVLRSPWPWFHQVSAPSLQRFIRIWSCDNCSIVLRLLQEATSLAMAASSMTRWFLHGSGAFGKNLLPIRPAQWCNPTKKWVLLSHPHKGSTWAQVPEILIHWFVLRQSTPWLLSVLPAGCCGSQGRSGWKSGRSCHGDQHACCCPHQRQHLPNTNSG